MLKEEQVNKRELVSAVAAHTDTDNKSVQKIVDGTVEVILATVAKGEVVNLAGFAKFERKSRPARLARNPQTGATVKVPAKKVAKITALKGFKDVALGTVKPPKLAAAPVKKAPAKTAVVKKAAPVRKAPAKKAPVATKAAVKKAAPVKKAPVKKAPATKAAARTTR
jgi:DNA-binding protein HU-beta